MNPVILVVDDYDPVRLSLKLFLESNGFAVRLASGGSEALLIAQQEMLHGAITDINMPGMNGYRVCENLRALKSTLPVWLMTAAPGCDLPQRATAAGAVGVFAKPFDYQALLAALRHVVADSAAFEARAAGPAKPPPP